MAHVKSSIECNGERISELRKAKGWTREDLAEKAGVSYRTLGSMETGKRVTLLTAGCVAEALGVLVPDITTQAHTVDATPPRASLSITFNLTFQDTDEAALIESLEALIMKLTGNSGSVAFNAMVNGSVVLTIECDIQTAVELVALEARLHAIGIRIGMTATLTHIDPEAVPAFNERVRKRQRKPIKYEDITIINHINTDN